MLKLLRVRGGLTLSYDAETRLRASQFLIHASRISLTPRFSGVVGAHLICKRFSGFSWASKPLKRF
jgi:hypothetical protein